MQWDYISKQSKDKFGYSGSNDRICHLPRDNSFKEVSLPISVGIVPVRSSPPKKMWTIEYEMS